MRYAGFGGSPPGGRIAAWRENPRRAARAWYVVALLFGVYVMNMADRQIVGILAQDIKRDLHLTDAQLGFLGGPAIGFFYAILGIPMAYAADRIHRVRFIGGCIAIWSFFTILGGRVTGFAQLALTRVGVSVAEAGGSPSSVSLIADLFPPERRGTAMAVWTSSTAVAIFVGFAVGGTVNQALGWRDTFLLAGIPGILLALLLVFTVREPVRGASDAVAAPKAETGLFQTVARLWAIRPFRQMVFAVSLCNFCVFAVLSWAPSHAMRSFGLGSAEVGGVMGTGIAVAGGAMMVLSGILTDWLTRGGLYRAVFAVAGMMAVSAAGFTAAFLAHDFASFSLFFLIGYAALMTNPPVSWVILQKYAPPEMRAMATAVLLLVIALTAMVPAPWIVGRVSDLLAPSQGTASLGHALLLAPVAVLLAGLQWARTAVTVRGGTMTESGLNPRQIGI